MDGTNLQAQLVGTDPADDLAVIQITPPSNGLTVAHIGDSSKLNVGQDVIGSDHFDSHPSVGLDLLLEDA